jgi:hypothetical protein
VAREGVDAPRAALTGLIRAAQERGELRAAPPPDGLIRVFIAIYQGLALQTAWDADLDHDAYVRAVEVIVDALT